MSGSIAHLLRLATFNVHWWGGDNVARPAEAPQHLAEVLARLDADVVVFQEIVRQSALADVIERVNRKTGRPYRIRNDHGEWIASGTDGMHVAIAYDSRTLELLAAGPIHGGHRPPCAASFVDKQTRAGVTVVGVHLQSGYPDFDDRAAAEVRHGQCRQLVAWLHGEQQAANPLLPKPPTRDVVVLGDFNALNGPHIANEVYEVAHPEVTYQSLSPLREGAMAGWGWPQPDADVEGGPFSAHRKQLMVDFIILSPSLARRVVTPPALYAFDRDPALPAPAREISDHRPVVVGLTLSA